MNPELLYESESCIVLNKPPTMPVQPDPSGDASLLDWAMEKTGSTLFVVHRIDRPVSGAVLFAKNKAAAAYYSDLFSSQKIIKKYIAAVRKTPPKPEDALVHFLVKNKDGKSKIAAEGARNSKRAELHYKILGKSDHFTFLEIQLLTGRHHQIRAQLAAVGCTIKGDVRYGDRRANKDRSIHLHAVSLEFEAMETGERVKVEADFPQDPVWDFFKTL